MSPLAYLKVALVLLVIALGWFANYTYEKLIVSREQLKQVTGQLAALKLVKEKSDKAVAELTTKLNTNQQVVTKTITRLVKVPVTVQEACMSDVLKESLKEEQID